MPGALQVVDDFLLVGETGMIGTNGNFHFRTNRTDDMANGADTRRMRRWPVPAILPNSVHFV